MSVQADLDPEDAKSRAATARPPDPLAAGAGDLKSGDGESRVEPPFWRDRREVAALAGVALVLLLSGFSILAFGLPGEIWSAWRCAILVTLLIAGAAQAWLRISGDRRRPTDRVPLTPPEVALTLDPEHADEDRADHFSGLQSDGLRSNLVPSPQDAKVVEGPDAIEPVCEEAASNALAAADAFAPVQMGMLFELIVHMPKWRESVNEDIKITRTFAMRRIAASVNIPKLTDNDHEQLLLPIMHARKGALYDSFDLKMRGGARIDLLEIAQCQLIASGLVVITAAEVLGVEAKILVRDRKMRLLLAYLDRPAWDVHWKERNSIRALRGCVSQTIDEMVSAQAQGNVCDPKVQDLKELCMILVSRYVLIAQCAHADRVGIQYSYRQRVHELFAPEDTRPKLSELRPADLSRIVRRWFGRPAGVLDIGLSRALRSACFDVTVELPPNSYIAEQAVVIGGTDQHKDDRKLDLEYYPRQASSKPYIRRIRLGANVGHLHSRGLGQMVANPPAGITPDRFERCRLRLRVREKPTGTELLALAVSWSVLVMALIFRSLSREETVGADVLIIVSLSFVAALAVVASAFARCHSRSFRVSNAGQAVVFGVVGMGVAATVACDLEIGYQGYGLAGWWWWWASICGLLLAASLTITSIFVIRGLNYRRLTAWGRLWKRPTSMFNGDNVGISPVKQLEATR